MVNFGPNGDQVGEGSGRMSVNTVELSFVQSGQKEQASLTLSEERNVLLGKTCSIRCGRQRHQSMDL
jgi:hypothetical protein